MSTSAVTNFFFLNTRLAPFDDVRVRRAVNYAFDRQAFAAMLGRAFAPTCQIFPPNYPSFHRTCPFVPGGVAGLDKARALVRASGTTGQSVRVWAPGPIAEQARFLAAVLRSLGLRANPHVIRDPTKYFSLILDSRNRVQTGYYGWGSDFPSEAGFLRPLFTCGAFIPANRDATTDPSGFCDRSIDSEIDRAAAIQAQDPPAARSLWRKIEHDILAQAPMVPTYNRKSVDFVGKRVGNYQYNPQWRALIDQLWVR
jgi:peptide/nickel transport system substrate-binding protein